jgi:hypothetical protein
MQLTFSRHALRRIQQRSSFKIKVIKYIFKRNFFITIGHDLFKKNLVHCLFFNKKDLHFYILVVDERNSHVVTILYGEEFTNWCIDPFLFEALEQENYDLKRKIFLDNTPLNHYSVSNVLDGLDIKTNDNHLWILGTHYDLSKTINPKRLKALIKKKLTTKTLTDEVVNSAVSVILTQLNYQ